MFFAPMNILRLPDFYFTAGDAFACGCLMMMLINGSLSLRPLGPGTAFWIFGLALLAGSLLTSSLLASDVDRALILVGQYLFAYLLLPIILLARPWAETTTLMRVFVASIARDGPARDLRGRHRRARDAPRSSAAAAAFRASWSERTNLAAWSRSRYR